MLKSLLYPLFTRILFSLVLFTGSVYAAMDLYVSPDGVGTNSGTINSPFATINQARDAVRHLHEQGYSSDITIFLRNGFYALDSPLLFEPQDSGPGFSRITYRAFPGETSVLSGGRKISGWQINKDGIWQVELSNVKSGKWTFRNLYVNGENRPRCKHPNNDPLRVESIVDDRRIFKFKAGEIPQIKDMGNSELLFLHDWSISRNQIGQIDFQSGTLETRYEIGGYLPFWRIDGFEKHPRYWLENHIAFLDTPGEWYLDNSTGMLYYFPMPQETIENTEVIAPLAAQLVVFKGDEARGQFVKNITYSISTFCKKIMFFTISYYLNFKISEYSLIII